MSKKGDNEKASEVATLLAAATAAAEEEEAEKLLATKKMETNQDIVAALKAQYLKDLEEKTPIEMKPAGITPLKTSKIPMFTREDNNNLYETKLIQYFTVLESSYGKLFCEGILEDPQRVAMENAARIIKKEIQDRKDEFGEKEINDWVTMSAFLQAPTDEIRDSMRNEIQDANICMKLGKHLLQQMDEFAAVAITGSFRGSTAMERYANAVNMGQEACIVCVGTQLINGARSKTSTIMSRLRERDNVDISLGAEAKSRKKLETFTVTYDSSKTFQVQIENFEKLYDEWSKVYQGLLGTNPNNSLLVGERVNKLYFLFRRLVPESQTARWHAVSPKIHQIVSDIKTGATTGTPTTEHALYSRLTTALIELDSIGGGTRSRYQALNLEEKERAPQRCREFIDTGECARGNECKFAHPKFWEKIPICRNFKRGKCGMRKCRYRHVQDDDANAAEDKSAASDGGESNDDDE